MTTVQDLVREVRQESEQKGLQRGLQQGLQQGLLTTLTDYVRLGWGDTAATAFWMQLVDAQPEQLPSLTELQRRLQRKEPPLPQENGGNSHNAD